MASQEIVKYSDLDDKDRKVVHETYNEGWWMCHQEELLLDSSLPRKLRRILRDNHDEAKRQGIEESRRQWEIAANIFPEGQNVLLTRDGKTQVAYHIRSNIIDVPKMPSFREWQAEETANYPADKWLQFEYPRTWYLVSDDGTIRKSHNPDGKVLVNFAVTNNTKVKASGALEKIVGNQLKLAQERDLYCHTFTPMNEHGPISSPILTAEETEEYLLKTFKGEVISPTGIHTYFMAKNAFGKKAKREGEDDPEILTFRRSRIPLIFELARLKRDAGYACCVTAYNGPGLEVEPGWHIRYISPRGA